MHANNLNLSYVVHALWVCVKVTVGGGRHRLVGGTGRAGLASGNAEEHILAMHDDDDPDLARRTAAQAWIAKLSSTSIGTDDLQAFSAWRKDPANQRVWDALAAGRQAVNRFVVRPETERYRVVDIWTGQTAVIAMTAQDDMSEEDALHTARLLNRRSRGGDRSVPQ